MHPSTTICDFCATGFACSRLATALKLYDAAPAFAPEDPRSQRFAAIRQKLDDLGWGYPDNGYHCLLAGHSKEVQALTNDLIELLESRKYAPGGVRDAPSLYDDEVSSD